MNDDNRSNILFFGNKSNTNNIILNNINPNNNRNIPSETSFKNNSSPVNVMMSGRSVLYPPGFPPPSSSSDPRVLQSQQFHSVPHAVPGSSGPSIPVSHAALYGQHIPAQVSLPSGVPYLFREGHFPVDQRQESFHVDRFGRPSIDISENMNLHHSSPSGSSQQQPRRRPSLLPPTAPSDFPYSSSLVQPHFPGNIESERFMEYSFSAYDRNKSLSQQHAVAAAQVAHSRGLPASSMSHPSAQQQSQQQQPLSHSSLMHGHRQVMTASSLTRGHPISGSYDHMSEESAPKRPRLFPESKPSHLQPLHIQTGDIIMSDLGKKPAYIPQVEAISPTLPNEDSRAELSPFKATKDELYQNINRIEREIQEAETQIAKLRRKQHELEASSKSSGDGIQASEPTTESKQQSVAQIVYSDNRKKAQEAHSLFQKFNCLPLSGNDGIVGSCLPLYNQPSDTLIYHKNREKFKDFKTKLMTRLKKQREEERKREQFLTQTYDRLSSEWRTKLDSKEVGGSKKSKEAKLRDFFEKQFPELRKQREDKERLSRAGQRIRSDADMEDIMEGIQEQEAEDKKMRSYAVIPPILQDKKTRKPVFINRNNLLEDPMSEYKDRQHINVWVESEKEIFREKFLLHPKNFGLIASYLEKKSVADCVQYYYLSKKSENYKQLLRKHVKKRTRALVKQQQQAAQAAAQAAAAAAQQKQSALIRLQQQQQLEKAQQQQQQNNANDDDKNKKDSNPPTEKSKTDEVTRSSEKENEPLETNKSSLECNVCHKKLDNESKSKAITKSNCHVYGMPAESLPNNARSCLECRIKYNRKQCPIPSCKTPERKVKRLKSLPQAWFDLSVEARKSYSDDMNLPQDLKKGCTRCVLRISRKIGAFSNEKTPSNEVWPDDDINLLKRVLKDHGKNWTLVAEAFRNKKTLKECKKFYYRYKYKIDAESKAPGDPDTDSDEYWNDMSDDSEETSSADEGNGPSTSDTASAPSPPVTSVANDDIRTMNAATTTGFPGDLTAGKLSDLRGLSASQASLKSDNDSSATMSADEGHGDPEAHRPISPAMRPTPPMDVRSLSRPPDSLYPSSQGSPLSFSTSRPPEGLIAQRQQRVPSFLINPNAPSTNNSRSHTSTIPLPNIPSSLPRPSDACQGNSKTEEPTCVRDLIYQAIEMSLQTPVGKGNSSPAPSVKGIVPHPSSLPSSSPSSAHPPPPGTFLGIAPNILHSSDPSRRDSPNVAQDSRSHSRFTPPSNLSRPEGLMMSYHLSAAQQQRPSPVLVAQETEGVQDLSKKSRSVTPSSQRKDSSRPVTPNRSPGFPYQVPPSMPPPAHSNPEHLDASRRDQYYPGLAAPGVKPAHHGIGMPRPPPRTPVVSSRPQGPPPPLINSSQKGRPPSPPRHFQTGKDIPRSMVGSITQGTPVILPVQSPGSISLQHNPYGGQRPSYDLIRPHAVPKESGSITLGTPVHHDPSKRKPEERKLITGPGGMVFEHPSQMEQFYRRRSPNPSPGHPHSSSPLSRPPSGMIPHPGDPFMQYMAKQEKERGQHSQMMPQYSQPHPGLHPTKDQLLQDFNTSRQMMARRGSSGDAVKEVLPRDSRGRESPQVIAGTGQRFQAMYPVMSVTGIHPGSHSGPIYTPSTGDNRSMYPPGMMDPRSIPPTSSSSPVANQARQNVIQGWSGKPPPGTSVIQMSSKPMSSPRGNEAGMSHQRNEVPSPQSMQRKVLGPSPIFNPSAPPALDNFQTLVNAAAAQQTLPVPGQEQKHMQMHDRRMMPNPYAPKEMDSRSPRPSEQGRQVDSRDDRRPSSRPDGSWSDIDPNKPARDRIRQIFMAVPNPEEQRQRQMEIERQIAISRATGLPHHPGIPGMTPEAALAYTQHRMREAQFQMEQNARDHQHLLHLHESGQLGGPRREQRGSPPDDGRYRPPPMTLSRQQKAELDNEASRIFSQSFQKDPSPSQGTSSQRFTTGNLIDAIITHQINQTSDGKNDRESKDHDRDQRNRPPLSHARITPPSEHQRHQERLIEEAHSNQRLMQERSRASSERSDNQSLTLGDTISSIISKSFGEKPPSAPSMPMIASNVSRPTFQSQENRLFSSGFYQRPDLQDSRPPPPARGSEGLHQERPPSTGGSKEVGSSWKLRRALQQEKEASEQRADSSRNREGPSVEPISPPSSQSEEKRPPSNPTKPEGKDTNERPPSHNTSSRHSLEDRTPPALEILEDASEGRPPSNSWASSTSTPESSDHKSRDNNK